MSVGDFGEYFNDGSRIPTPPMEIVFGLWAKTQQCGDTQYHPLLCHMLDVTSVAEALWDENLPAATKVFLCDALGLASHNAARTWVTFFAGLHDLGKASPAFQAKSAERKTVLEAQGFTFPLGAKAYHGSVSAKTIGDLLTNPPFPLSPIASNTAKGFGIAIGGHHGILPTGSDLRPDRLDTRELGEAPWLLARTELFRYLAGFTGVIGGESPCVGTQQMTPVMLLLAGLISVADWVGSSHEHFPYAPGCDDFVQYGELARQKAREALRQLGWVDWQPAGGEASFSVLFPEIRRPRPMQDAVVQLTGDLKASGFVLIEAPTGEGKTEAAFYLADHWNRILEQKGCYVAMPTQATANAMLGRFQKYLRAAYPDQTVNLHLIHGQAALSDEYQQLQHIGQVYDDDGSGVGEVVARGWFTYRKRGLLGPFAVGTVDQALLAVLRTKHVFVRLFGLANKTIILDEIHAYDTYTSTVLDRLLEWLAALGSSVILLSATLPSHRRAELLAAYGGKQAQQDAPPYPRITWTCDGRDGASTFEVRRRDPLALNWVDGNLDTLADELSNKLSDGGCAACICNTVKQAQDTYLALKKALADSDIELDLFHARFPFVERQRREQRAVHRFGKDSKQRPDKAILVATQVIEQSLDIDFDLMVSEVAPVDLLIQRAGRLHRHAHRERPQHLATPTLWLMRPPEDDNGLPDFGPSVYVYSEYVLLRTWVQLRQRESIMVPDDVSPLIEAVYTRECEAAGLPPELEARMSRAWAEQQQETAKLTWLAKDSILKRPEARVPLSEMTRMDLADDEDPRIHAQLRAMTRWSDRPSITVVFLYGSAEDCYLDADHARPIALQHEPDREQAKLLVERSVSLTGYPLHEHFLDAEVAAWRRNALLRHLRVGYLDADGRCPGEGFVITVDPELGVIVDYTNTGGDDK